ARRRLAKRPHPAAVNCRYHGVSDDRVAEGQHPPERAVAPPHRDAEKTRIRNGIDDITPGSDFLLLGTRRCKVLPPLCAPSMKVPRQLANGSSGARSYAMPRMKATLRVTL